MKKSTKIQIQEEEKIAIIKHIHKGCFFMFHSILAKRTTGNMIERNEIIDRFFQREFCRMPAIQIKRIWKGGRGKKAIQEKFHGFLDQSTRLQIRRIEGKTRIIIHLPDAGIITHSIDINPTIEIRRYRNIISNEFHSEHFGLIFELMSNGLSREEISIKTGQPISKIENIIQKIISYLHSIA